MKNFQEWLRIREAGTPHNLGPKTDDWRDKPLTPAGMHDYKTSVGGGEGATELPGHTPKRVPTGQGGFYAASNTAKKRAATDNKRLAKRVTNTADSEN